MDKQVNKAIFLDRDGVIIEDIDLLIAKEQIKFFTEIFESFKLLRETVFKSFVVTNQPVVARGMINEEEVKEINNYISNQIFKGTNYRIDKFYYCPHHPNADLEDYRENCDCRKPKSGMLLKAAAEFNISLQDSWMIGDRISDIIAGHNVECKTILLETGRHLERPIESDAMDLGISPDFVCKNLLEAVEIILKS